MWQVVWVLPRPAFYYYVSTKEDLIYQCYDANMRQAHAQLDAAEAACENPGTCLMMFLESQINTTLLALDGEGDFYAAPLEVASFKEEHRLALEEEYRRLLRRLIDLLNRGIDLGEIRPCNPVVTIRAMIGALDWSFYWLYEMPRDQANTVIDVLRDLFTHGLLCSPDSQSLQMAPEMLTFSQRMEALSRPFLRREPAISIRRVFSGTSLDEIAEQPQVSKGAFYYHFANKEALLAQCFDYTLDRLEQIIAGIEQLKTSPANKLALACHHIFVLQNSEQGPLVHFNSITALPPAVRQRLLARLAAVHRTSRRPVVEATSDGEFRAVSAGIVIQLSRVH